MEKRILFIITGFLAGAGIGLFVFYNLTGQFPSLLLGGMLTSSTGILGIFLLWIFYTISQWLNKKLAWEKQFSSRIALDFLINSIIAIISSGLVHFALLSYINPNPTDSLWVIYKVSFLTLWIMMVVLVLMYNIIMLIFYAYAHYAEGQIAEVNRDRKQLKLQFESLKNQLSPHFLFNSLNTISSLIHQDELKAEEFIRRLADTYQYVLGTHQQKLITLEKEIEFVNAYYFLLCVRFQEGLNLKINIPKELLSHEIPPLTIQILIENAIKHNAFSKDEPLNINLSVVDSTEIKVVNNKTHQPLEVKSNHIGLKNIQKRYSYFTNNKVKIIDKTEFEVRVPIMKTIATNAA